MADNKQSLTLELSNFSDSKRFIDYLSKFYEYEIIDDKFIKVYESSIVSSFNENLMSCVNNYYKEHYIKNGTVSNCECINK